MASEIPKIYSNRVRVRVCGLCWRDGKLLLVNLRGITAGNFWSPPGGGLEFGETATEALMREFREETHVDVLPGQFRFACEYIHRPSAEAGLHAIELFFDAAYVQGEARKGTDPESEADPQLIAGVAYMTIEEILNLPAEERHGVFRLIRSAADLKSLSGFHRI